MSTATRRTQSTARNAANAVLQHGYYQATSHVYQRCPRCRQDVKAWYAAHARTNQRVAALQDALIVHLEDDCDGTP